MSESSVETLSATLLRQAHPWHGVNPTVETDGLLVYIENIPFSKLKYEVDGDSGLLRVDRPQETSALPPAAYGFVPRTLCGPKVAQLNSRLRGDRAALDVFVLSERAIEVPGVLAKVELIGGVPVQDETYVDDKLIAVLHRDTTFGAMRDISEVPIYVMERICHFLTQETTLAASVVGDPFGRERAGQLLQAALEDYRRKYPE